MTQEQFKCPICDNNANKINFEHTFRVNCELCGDFNIGGIFDIPSFTEEEKLKLRYWYAILDKNDQRRASDWITDENKKDFLSKINDPPSSLLDKIGLVLEYIYSKTKFFGQEIYIFYRDYRLFFCKDLNELNKMTKYLEEQNYIICYGNTVNPSNPESVGKALNNLLNNKYSISLTAAGIKKVEESGKNPNSKQCFVAMWFNEKEPDMQKIYSDIIEPAIEAESGYDAMKIDNKEHINCITDEIVKEIRRSKFMIADLTGSRGGVYYEAGFAFGLGIPVIFTCNKKWEDKVHFDVKQKNMIFWDEDKLDEFQEALVNRIGAVIGLNK